MKIKLMCVSGIFLFMLSPVSGLQSNKKFSQQKRNRKDASPKNEEYKSPRALSLDSTAIAILDGKIIPFKTFVELSNKKQLKVIEPIIPKEAIPLFGEIARGGALRCVTVNN